MSALVAQVEAALRPRLLALAAVDPEAAAIQTARLAESKIAFARGAWAFSAAELALRVGMAGSWVWAAGDAHPDAFATLACARPDADGACPVAFELAEAEEEHPAPWRWDLVRLLSCVVLANPEQKGSAFAHLVGRTLDGYAAALEARGEAAIALSDLPAAIAELVAADSGVIKAISHLSAAVQGEGDDARLRLSEDITRDLSARAFFLPALASLYPDAMRITALDVARLADDPLAPGRRRWRALIRERGGSRQDRMRLLEIRERPAGELAHLLQPIPFGPGAGPSSSATAMLGQDPLQRLLHGPDRTYAVRTACHARKRVDWSVLAEDDLVALAKAWGLLLGNFHLRGLRALRADLAARAAQVATELAEARKDMSRLAWEHAAAMAKAHAAFRTLSRSWPD